MKYLAEEGKRTPFCSAGALPPPPWDPLFTVCVGQGMVLHMRLGTGSSFPCSSLCPSPHRCRTPPSPRQPVAVGGSYDMMATTRALEQLPHRLLYNRRLTANLCSWLGKHEEVRSTINSKPAAAHSAQRTTTTTQP